MSFGNLLIIYHFISTLNSIFYEKKHFFNLVLFTLMYVCMYVCMYVPMYIYLYLGK